MATDMTQSLLVFGLVWTLVGCGVGFYQGVRHTKHHEKLDALARAGDLSGYNEEVRRFKQMTNAHTHTMLFPVVLMLVALGLPWMSLPGSGPLALATGLVAATVVWSVGGVLNVKALKGLGDVLLTGSIGFAIYGLLMPA